MGDKKKIIFTFIVLPIVLVAGLAVSLMMNRKTDGEGETNTVSDFSKDEEIDRMLLEEFRKSQATREYVEYSTEEPEDLTPDDPEYDDMIDFSEMDFSTDSYDSEDAVIAEAERRSWEEDSKYVASSGIEIVSSMNQLATNGDWILNLSDDELRASHPLFLQYDPRWATFPYGNGTMKSSACGPTSFSMVITALTNITYASPPYIATYSMNHGYYVSNVGTAHELFWEAAPEFGLYCNRIANDEAEFKRHLDSGEMLILAMHVGHFTSCGHFIVVYGYDNNGFMVNDPGSFDRSTVYWPFSILGSEADNVYALGRD
ncbi:MAG: C39 family peptidase [Eubacterium sp.]|nr:C39 family peptidase [Eubacterium sp.]